MKHFADGNVTNWITRVALLLAAAALTACASGPRTVDTDVRTVTAQGSGAAVLQGAHYRFEPSQSLAGQIAPDKLQAMAQTALTRVGLVRDDAHARISVQVSGGVSAYWYDEWRGRPYGWGYPRFGWGLGYGWGGGAFGWGYGGPLWDPSIPAYVSEVGLLMRDLKTGQIVYDTRARHDGPWHDTDNVLAALFAAALEGYPQPAQTVRRVDVPLVPVAAPTAAAPATATPVPSAAPTAAPARPRAPAR